MHVCVHEANNIDLRLCHTPGDGPTAFSGWSIIVVARTSEKIEGREVVLFTVPPVAFRFRKAGERCVVGGVVTRGVFASALDSELIFVWVLSDTALYSEPLGDSKILLLSAASQLEKIFMQYHTPMCKAVTEEGRLRKEGGCCWKLLFCFI